MSASRRSHRSTARPLALLAGVSLISAGLALPAQAEDELPTSTDTGVSEDDGDSGSEDVTQERGTAEHDDGGAEPGGSDEAASEEPRGEDADSDDADGPDADGPGGENSVASDITPQVANLDGVYLSEVHFLDDDDEDFIEIGAEPGTDVGGWTVGTVTRGGNPQSGNHVVTLDEGTEVPDNGVLDVGVPITNATTNGWGSSAFIVTAEDEIAAFYTIGSCSDHDACDEESGGIIAGGSANLPGALHGETAAPTDVIPPAGQSLQLLNDEWTSGEPSRGEPNEADNGNGEDPAEPEELTIADIWGEDDDTAVTTTGVVTAHYPSGGFNGYVIQTAGSGGDTDLSEREVSDALFVYSPDGVDDVALGDYVQVTGERTTYEGLHQISVNTSVNWHEVSVLDEDFDAVVPVSEFVLPADEGDRLAFQNMLVHPADRYTVSDTYQLGGFGDTRFGSIGLGLDGPLVQETELVNPVEDPDGHDALVAENDARAVTLDDGQSERTPFDSDVPYLTGVPDLRTGVDLTFHEPVIVDYRFQWNFQPTETVTGNADDLVSFESGDTREANAAPAQVGGDVTVAIFNVLNYFTTLGADLPDCTPFTDRDGNPLTVNNCTDPDPGPRGAWGETSLERQQDKIVTAINELDADVVALSEIENSAHFNEDGDRDESLGILVDALNDDAGSEVWALAASPEEVPDLAHDDVIRNAFIYQPGAVEPAGEGVILTGQSEDGDVFDNAREPLAQGFGVVGSDYEFLAVANHFKSKGCGGYDGDEDAPQSCFNGDRVEQANSLMDFADEVAGQAGIEDILLMGDLNAYSAEDPMRALEAEGYVNANPAWSPDEQFTGDNTYVFDGRVGSLDHIMMSSSAAERHMGTEVWSINANESVLAEYSRYNYFASEHFTPEVPFRSSDHDPVVIGLDVPADDGPGLVDLSILSFNDLHGRIGSSADNVGEPAIAAGMACFAEDYRDQNPNTLLVSAGDNIGATTFTSFIDQDLPTLDVLNELDLDVSALGNHEFDQGQEDVDDRVIPYSDFPWIAANIVDDAGELVYDPYVIVESGGLNVAFIGAITEDMPRLVTPSGIEGLTFTSISEAVNTHAEELTSGDDPEADVVIAVVHEGLPTPSLDSAAGTPFGELIDDAHDSISAIISGHTHLRYAHETGEEWVTQTGQYGEAMGVLDLTIDTETGAVVDSTARNEEITPVGAEACAAAAPMMGIVDEARENADELGSRVIGEATHDFNRAENADESENRGGESVLGALVADAQLWAAQRTHPEAQIAFTNSGGLREDLAAGEITVRDAGDIQPFANTLVSVEVSGAQLAQVLEEQWRDTDEFSKLAQSSGFRYTYDPAAEPGERILQMFLDDEPVQDDDDYTVVVNSHMAGGGSGMETLPQGRNIADTGQSDLDAMVEYIEEQSTITPDFTQRAVGVTWISDPDAVYTPGDEIALDVSSFIFTAGEPVPEVLHTYLGETATGEFDLDTEIVDNTDESGQAEIRVTVPESVALVEMSGGLGTMQAPGASGDGPVEFPLQIVDETNGTLLVLPVLIETAAAGPGPELPDTGAEITWIALGVLVLLAAGAVLLIIRRRSTPADSGD